VALEENLETFLLLHAMETFLHFIYINLDRSPLLHFLQQQTLPHYLFQFGTFDPQVCFAVTEGLEI